MSNIDALKREALAVRVTGWQGDPIAPQPVTAADVCALIRTASVTERQAIDILQALSCRLHALGCDDDVIQIIDQCSDDITVPIARAEEAAALKAGWENLQHEADIMRGWA